MLVGDALIHSHPYFTDKTYLGTSNVKKDVKMDQKT